jgi:hypothetical protein
MRPQSWDGTRGKRFLGRKKYNESTKQQNCDEYLTRESLP